jgi:hypothetical protein
MQLYFFLARLALPFVFVAGAMGWSFIQAKHETRDRKYPFPIAAVNETVDESELPKMVFGDRAATARHWRLNQDTSAWALENEDGDEYMRLTAKTTADGKGTRIHYETVAPPGENQKKVEEFFKNNSAMVDTYTAALAEQIDSALTRRPFSIANIMGATSRGALSQVGMMREYMAGAAAEGQKESDDNVERAYEREAVR